MADAEVELQQIGPYAITRKLTTGSTSDLYLGKQRKKDIVIEVFHTFITTLAAKEAFLARIKQLKKLKHRYIAEVLDGGFSDLGQGSDEYGYLVMQSVEGETALQRFAPDRRYTAVEVKPFISTIASALHYAHVSAIIHGNLHPGNILIDSRNDILLTHFSLDPPQSFLPFAQEQAAIPYMAPDQLRGTPSADSDQYALAVMAYEWLCGRRPYLASTKEELLYQQEHEPMPTPRSLNEALSASVERVLLQALAYTATERFQHCQEFADNYLHAIMGLPLKTEPRRAAPIYGVTAIINNGATQLDSTNEATNMFPLDHSEYKDANSKHTAPFIAESPSSKTNGRSKSKLPYDIAASANTADLSAIADAVGASTEVLSSKKREKKHENERQEDIAPTYNDETRLHDIVTADLCQGGILSQRLPGYEERPAQIEMATLVARSLTQNVPAIIEAGTGTGKSLAYLVPIVRSGKVAIISTANKALQEQLFYKDIPFVQQHIKPFDAALVKGVGNYLCLDRMESERNGMQYYVKNREFMRLVDITNDPDAAFNGDFETLDFPLPTEIRSKVCTDSDQCAWSKCSFFADCYVRKMRDKAERAQVIVVNHTLLLLDAAMDGYLLPERDIIVLDEAHHLEEEATRAFTITISSNSVVTLLAQRMLKDHSQLSLQDNANRELMHAWERLQLVADPGYKGRANLQAPFEEGLKLATAIADLADSLRKQRPKSMPEKEEQLFDKLLKRTQNLAQNIRTVFAVDQPDKFVYYVERVGAAGQRGGPQLQVSAAPLDVTEWLKERLFDKCNVICTSATLATVGPNPARPEEKGPNFAYYRRRIGLHDNERYKVLERILPLSFDYESNALLYLPRDVPAPVYGAGSDDYTKAIAREMYRLVKFSRGRAFLLFSSKRMLDQAYDLMSPHLDYPLLRQGDMSRIELTRRFREEQGAILFGLKSFWEGVDIAGEALSMVVIDKLPFDPPDDPVHEARVAQMKAAGENWFGIYVLPQAVLRLKQGLGRLLRSREDRGVMAILDSRLYSKGYGKLVLDALPPARRTSNIKEVDRFFNEER
nr:helicase C-terminal domain-containing protein [Ktedonobacteraceae bacterium]